MPKHRSTPADAPVNTLTLADLPRHRLSEAWGDLSETEFAALTADVRRNGVLDPVIVVFQFEVLDGFHRTRAAALAGMEHRLKRQDFEGSYADAIAYTISRHAHRRHQSAGVRAVVVAQLYEDSWRTPGRPAGNSAPGAGFLTAEQLASIAGVGVRTMAQAQRVIRAGKADAVKSGEQSLKAADAAVRETVLPPPPPDHEPSEPVTAAIAPEPVAEAPKNGSGPSQAERKPAIVPVQVEQAERIADLEAENRFLGERLGDVEPGLGEVHRLREQLRVATASINTWMGLRHDEQEACRKAERQTRKLRRELEEQAARYASFEDEFRKLQEEHELCRTRY